MMVMTFLHFGLFVLNLVFVGFYPMLTELGLMILCFTVYLTLREYMIIIYILSLIAGGIFKFKDIFEFASTSLLFYIMDIAFSVLASLYVARYYIAFRLAGGRKMKYYAFNKQAEAAGNLVQSAAV